MGAEYGHKTEKGIIKKGRKDGREGRPFVEGGLEPSYLSVVSTSGEYLLVSQEFMHLLWFMHYLFPVSILLIWLFLSFPFGGILILFAYSCLSAFLKLLLSVIFVDS